MKSVIYMDYAAATPVDAPVLSAMQPYFVRDFYNPSANYLRAQQVKRDLESARSHIAQVLGARSNEIVFTAGGTEANNLAIQGVVGQFPGGNIITTAIEHESVLVPAKQHPHKIVPVDKYGIVMVKELLDSVDDSTVLVSVMYANNEVGTIQPIRHITRGLERIRIQRRKVHNVLPLYFHIDAAQAANYLDLHVSRLGVDLMTLNGGKIYGPKASGALFVKRDVRIKPIITGGGQERNYRSGTENVPSCIGFAVALTLTQAIRQDETARLVALQKAFFQSLQKAIPHAFINGSLVHRLPNNIHITIPGSDNERLLYALDDAGILAAAGSACSASDEAPSHVLIAMGIDPKDAASSLRFTLGRDTNITTIHQVVKTLSSLIA